MADWIDNEIAANKDNARARGRAERDDFPHATAAAYSPAHDLIVIDLENGSKFAFPPRIAQGLEHATPDQLSDIELTPGGYGLLWPKIDASLSVRGLLHGVMGSPQWAKNFARRGGQTSSLAKAAAARISGTKGGRPPRIGVQTHGSAHYIAGASGAKYLALSANNSGASHYGGVLVVVPIDAAAPRKIINATSINRQLDKLSDDPSILRIYWIREIDATTRKRIVNDLEAGVTIHAD